jgi:hypothetical protein
MDREPSAAPQARYDHAWGSANAGEARYLAAVSAGKDSQQLAALAGQARDLWAEVVVICGGSEAVARERIVSLPRVNGLQLLHEAWTQFSHWRGCSDDASARAQLFAALLAAHLGTLPPSRSVVRLDAIAADEPALPKRRREG